MTSVSLQIPPDAWISSVAAVLPSVDVENLQAYTRLLQVSMLAIEMTYLLYATGPPHLLQVCVVGVLSCVPAHVIDR